MSVPDTFSRVEKISDTVYKGYKTTTTVSKGYIYNSNTTVEEQYTITFINKDLLAEIIKDTTEIVYDPPKVKEFIDTLLPNFPWKETKAVWAGGSLFRTINDMDLSDDSDIDIFILGSGKQDQERINRVLDYMKKLYEIRWVRRGRVIDIFIKAGRHVQLVLCHSNDPMTVVKRFDFVHLQSYYDGSKLATTCDAYESTVMRTASISNDFIVLNYRFNTPRVITKEMCDFIGITYETRLPTSDVFKQVLKYVNKNNLWDSITQRFTLDSKLSKLFGIPVEPVTSMNFDVLIRRHLTVNKVIVHSSSRIDKAISLGFAIDSTQITPKPDNKYLVQSREALKTLEKCLTVFDGTEVVLDSATSRLVKRFADYNYNKHNW